MAADEYRRLACAGPGCERDACKRGLCLPHYKKAWKAGERAEARSLACVRCGAMFSTTQPSAIYCSRSCNAMAWAARNPEAAVRARRNRPRKERAKYLRTCWHCGKAWKADGPSAKWCSTACCSRAHYEAKHRAAGRVDSCCECGVSFCRLYGSRGSKPVCSASCQDALRRKHKHSGSHASRAKAKGLPRSYFNTLRVFERDRWTCQLCGCKTPKRLKGTTDPRAPELDHIVPLGAGGPHLPENCQCACRRCNGAKAARPLGQLILEGFGDTAARR